MILDPVYMPHRSLRVPLADLGCDGMMRIVDRDELWLTLECDRCLFDMALPLRELSNPQEAV